MNKETLSKYGWVVIIIIILVILMGFSSSFGLFIADSADAALRVFKVSTPFREHLGVIVETEDGVKASVEYYYSALNIAVEDINNDSIGVNADTTKENAVAGIYMDDSDMPVAVLLKDSTEDVKTSPKTDMVIKLLGNTLSVNNSAAIDVHDGNVLIDGRIDGSSIVMTHAANVGRCIQTRYADSLTVYGGEYKSLSDCTDNAAAIFTACDAVIKDVTITVESDATPVISGVWAPNNNVVEISDSNITVSGDCSKVYGVRGTFSDLTMNNSTVFAASPYLWNEDGTNYAKLSNGVVVTDSNVRINNCNITGVHSGVSTTNSTIKVEGGTYSGYGHGGFYLASNNSTPAYIYDATLVNLTSMPGGYTSEENGNNKSAIYIGGSNSGSVISNNFVLYMDGCKTLNAEVGLVLRGSSGETGHKVYVSNTTLNDGAKLRVDNDTHRLYIGENCNFDASDCINITLEQALERIITTNENYRVN